MAVWKFVVADTAGTLLGEVVGANARRVTWRLKAAADAACTIDGRTEAALALSELATDLVVLRDGVRVFRGRIGPLADDLEADKHDVSIQAADYRAVLGRRQLYDDVVFAAVDQAQIALDLVDYAQALTGGDLGIVQGVGFPAATGVVRDRTYEAGKWIGEAIAQLSEVIDGFDWEVDSDLALNVFYPERGATPEVVLRYGANVTKLKRATEPSGFANALRVTGESTLVPEDRESADLAVAPEGRWDAQAGYPDVVEQTTLEERADFLVIERAVLEPTYIATLRSGWWAGPDHLWLGDYVPLSVRSGRLDETELRRVTELAVAVDENGKELVTVTLGLPPEPSAGRRTPELVRRLEVLERR